jgi:hypothetical protein
MIDSSKLEIYIKKDSLSAVYYNILQIISELNICSAESLLSIQLIE